jgi:hypothetical protein
MDVKYLATFIPLMILLFTVTTFINQRLEIRRTYLRRLTWQQAGRWRGGRERRENGPKRIIRVRMIW